MEGWAKVETITEGFGYYFEYKAAMLAASLTASA